MHNKSKLKLCNQFARWRNSIQAKRLLPKGIAVQVPQRSKRILWQKGNDIACWCYILLRQQWWLTEKCILYYCLPMWSRYYQLLVNCKPTVRQVIQRTTESKRSICKIWQCRIITWKFICWRRYNKPGHCKDQCSRETDGTKS